MTDCNVGSYTDGNSTVYHDTSWYIPPSGTIIDAGEVGIITTTGVQPQNDNRKETDMINRQTFLDALVDEGKTVTSDERELIRCADDFRFSLLVACLLARVFETADLAMLREKPKEILIKEA